ncbi:ChrA protein [Paenibacillus sp. MY03]|uniref:chromate efflux transporter n=1 Tax=Paenibacillus sp. MY03 TaxID=302980 RepID=UPI000B3CA4F0|nr:chromate efflux transporter [Paenibacillus sp. MY03]OUS74895.1 ChrA protein [Paenibacillus sp. MY03]
MSGRGKRLLELFAASLKLGLTSFGGPVAHLGYFREEYVNRRKWLDDGSYADMVALAQFLPGPASSQVGIGIGIMRGGLLGGLISFLGFTLPSAAALALFALLLEGMGIADADWLQGLKLVAVAVVAHAVWGMGQKLAAGRARMTLALAAAIAALLWEAVYGQAVVIVLSAVLGLWLFREQEHGAESAQSGKGATSFGSLPLKGADSGSAATIVAGAGNHPGLSRRTGAICLLIFLLLLVLMPVAKELTANHWLALMEGYYRSGSLVFGGGHVVLPLLEREVVPVGLVTQEQFLAGYSAAQAVPGPLFTFAAYLGAVSDGAMGAIAATAAIFLPAYLLMAGVMPFWHSLRQRPNVKRALAGANAAVVGILLAALYDPVWTSAVTSSADFALAAALFILLTYWKLPPWAVVIIGALGGVLLNSLYP